jgi:hypothetical protein
MRERKDSNQHYVPQFLLRGFHAGSAAQIFVFDKLTRNAFTSPINRVASEPGFYKVGDSAALDEAMGRAEDSTAPIIERIKQRQSLASLDSTERVCLAGFTSLHS